MSCDIDRKKWVSLVDIQSLAESISSAIFSRAGMIEVMNQFRAERNQYGTLRIFCRTPAGPEACVCLRQYNRTTGAYE